MNAHSYQMDFCRSAYAVFRSVQSTPDSVRTDTDHTSTFSFKHVVSAPWSPMKVPRQRLTATTFNPIPRKKASGLATFHGATKKMILVGTRKYPCGGTLPCRSWRCACMSPKHPPPPLFRHTMVVRNRGVWPGSLWWEGTPLCHNRSCLRGPPGSRPTCYARSGLNPLSRAPLVCPSGDNIRRYTVHHWSTIAGYPRACPYILYQA